MSERVNSHPGGNRMSERVSSHPATPEKGRPQRRADAPDGATGCGRWTISMARTARPAPSSWRYTHAHTQSYVERARAHTHTIYVDKIGILMAHANTKS